MMEILDIAIRSAGISVIPLFAWAWNQDRRITQQETRADALATLASSVATLTLRVGEMHADVRVVAAQHADHKRRLERIEDHLDSGRTYSNS